MYKLDKNTRQTYKQFFFNGIENKEELLEGIIYFTSQREVINKHKQAQNTNKTVYYMQQKDYQQQDTYSTEERIEYKMKWKEKYRELNKIPTGEELLEEIIKTASQTYMQCYRFIELNDSNDDIFYYSKKEIEKDLQQRIQRKVEEKIKEGHIIIKEENITFSKEMYRKYIHYPEGSLIKNGNIIENPDYIMRHWTEEIYDILKYMEKLEKQEPKKYYEIWLRTRIRRIENKNQTSQEEKKQLEILRKIAEKVRKNRRNKVIQMNSSENEIFEEEQEIG